MKLEEFVKMLHPSIEFRGLMPFKKHDRIILFRKTSGITLTINLDRHFEEIPDESVKAWTFLYTNAFPSLQPKLDECKVVNQ